MSELGNLFNKYGCDKTKKHKYEKIYEFNKDISEEILYEKL